MALSEVEFEVEIKSPGSIVLEIYGSIKEYLPKISQFVERVELLEGEWGQVGCVIMACYIMDGKVMNLKETVEAVDENKSITYNFLEGDLMKLYKILRCTIKIISRNDAEFMKIKIEYEKQNEDVRYPDMLKAFITALTTDIDAHYFHVSNPGQTQS